MKMKKKMGNKNLTVDIYYDEYPRPRFVRLEHVYEVPRVIVTPATSVRTDPTTVAVSVPTSNVPACDTQINTKSLTRGAFICSALFCIGVLSIMIALEEK